MEAGAASGWEGFWRHLFFPEELVPRDRAQQRVCPARAMLCLRAHEVSCRPMRCRVCQRLPALCSWPSVSAPRTAPGCKPLGGSCSRVKNLILLPSWLRRPLLGLAGILKCRKLRKCLSMIADLCF